MRRQRRGSFLKRLAAFLFIAFFLAYGLVQNAVNSGWSVNQVPEGSDLYVVPEGTTVTETVTVSGGEG